MPVYEYRREDGTTFELIQSISDDPLKRDPETGQAVVRVLHAPAVHFKGSGFYNTDYGTRRRAREREQESASGDSKSKSESSGDGGSDKPKPAKASTDKGDKKSAKQASSR